MCPSMFQNHAQGIGSLEQGVKCVVAVFICGCCCYCGSGRVFHDDLPPARPGSPVSFVPFPFKSLKFIPEIFAGSSALARMPTSYGFVEENVILSLL